MYVCVCLYVRVCVCVCVALCNGVYCKGLMLDAVVVKVI